MPSERAIVTYRPDADEERLLAGLARKTGLNKSRLIGLAVRQMAERERVDTAPAVALTAEEQTRLDTLNAELPESFWQRYNAIAERSRANTLPDEERPAFLEMVQQSEAWNARRLELLEAFAQRRGMHFPALMRALGIQHHPYA